MRKVKDRVSHSPDTLDDLDTVKTKSKKPKVFVNNPPEKSKKKVRESIGQSSITSFFQSKNIVEDDVPNSNKSITNKKKKRRVLAISDESSNDFEEHTNDIEKEEQETVASEVPIEKKNAFTFMLDNRHKSIGQNSSGKELDKVEEPLEVKSEKKKKLSDRKKLLQDWSDRRGGKKRKVEDKERGIIIEKKLKDRSKRFKKMLKINDTNQTVELDSLEKKKKKKASKTKSKHENQKENNFLSNSNEGKSKWQMKLKINLSNEDTDKLSVPVIKEDTSSKKLDKLENSNLNNSNGVKIKSKNVGRDKDVTVAPVFKMGNSKSKSDESTHQARKEFLHSDLPETEKKHINKHQKVELPDYVTFPTISHVTIKPNEDQLLLLNQSLPDLNLRPIDSTLPKLDCLTKGCITHSAENPPERSPQPVFKKIKHYKKILKKIKEENPNYPVYKAFKYLYRRCKHSRKDSSASGQKLDDDVEIVETANSDRFQMWTDLYKPSTTEHVFGNQSAVNEIKTWLEKWIEYSKSNKTRRNSDSSSDFETDEEDSNDRCNALPQNTLILVGPSGCGKTMTVYAVCDQFDINVLEVNASSKRTGKKLLMELQEATQSHQVKKSSLNGFLHNSNVDAVDKMCLLLIEDVDVVFEQDDGFINSLFQLLTTSKRPIILTTTDKNCLHLQKFTSIFSTITFKKLSAKFLVPWLQLICLVEGLYVNKESITSLLENNNFDIRSTLLQLQIWSESGGQFDNLEDVEPKSNRLINTDEGVYQDDNSNMSCLKDEEDVSEFRYNAQRICTKSFKKSSLLDLDRTWLDLNMPPPSNTKTELTDVLNTFESLSAIDVLYRKLNIEQSSEHVSDSLELSESDENYTSCRDTGYHLAKTLMDIVESKTKYNKHPLHRVCLNDRTKCNDSLIEIVPVVCHMQRNSVNVDYLSTLRTINRTEIIRSNNNFKRINRFYHYLKGLGLNYSDANFATLSKTFSIEET